MDEESLKKLQEAAQSASEGDTSALLAGGESFLSNFSFWSILFGLAFSCYGIAAFRRGKKNTNLALMGIGIALMAYPYFIYNTYAVFGIGVVLTFAAYKLWNH